jgi:hypothetical protein
MKKQAKPQQANIEKIFVLHTPRCISNPKIGGVIIAPGAEGDVQALISSYGDKVRQVHVQGNNSTPLPVLKLNGVVKKYFTATKEEIIRHSKELKEQRWLVCPGFPVEKREDVSFITSMGVGVDLLYCIDQMKENVIMEILDFYLHYPFLEVPVEPFHSILMAKLKRKPLHLWNLHLLFPGLFLHADETGAADTPEQMQTKDYRFLIDWKTHTIKKNKNRLRNNNGLEIYIQSLPKTQPACMSCAHFHVCFGWGKYRQDTCQTWKTVLDTLQRSAKEILKRFEPRRTRRTRRV